MEYIYLHRYIKNILPDTRGSCRTPAESRQELPYQWKIISRNHAKLGRMEETVAGGCGRRVSRIGHALMGGETETGVQSLHWGNSLGQRRNI